jgi:vacuole morphology and inheritance protein 14
MAFCTSLGPFSFYFLTWDRKYLSDPTEDVRVATETILADFLREIRQITNVRKHHEEEVKAKQSIISAKQDQEVTPDVTEKSEEPQAEFLAESVTSSAPPTYKEERDSIDDRDTGGKLGFAFSRGFLSITWCSMGAWTRCSH